MASNERKPWHAIFRLLERDERVFAVLPVSRLEPLFACTAQHPPDHAPVQQELAPVAAGPVEDRVAREHAREDHGEREPPAEDPRMREDAGRDDRDFLGHRQAEPGGEEDEEEPDVP